MRKHTKGWQSGRANATGQAQRGEGEKGRAAREAGGVRSGLGVGGDWTLEGGLPTPGAFA